MRRLVFVLTFFSLVVFMWGGMHFLVWSRLAWSTELPAPYPAVLGFALALLAASTLASLLRVLPVPLLRRVWTAAFVWAGFVFILFFILLGADLFVAIAGSLTRLPEAVTTARIEAVVAVTIALALSAFACLRARGDAPIRRIEVTLDRLPPALSGFSIVQISDLHVAPDTSVPRIERLVQRVNGLSPDLIALTGDMVDGSPELLELGIAPLAALRAKHGSFFVTGNHEYFSGADRWMRTFQALGMRVLHNARVTVGQGPHSFELAGVPDWRGGAYGEQHRPRLADVLAGVTPDREIVLLAHQPRQFPDAAQLDVGLQLSGHTHGGQLWPFTWFIHLAERHVHGLHRVGRSQLYVSRGTGFWGPPMRLRAPSEISHITLRAATSP